MKTLITGIAMLTLAGTLCAQVAQPVKTNLKVGDMAPNFTLQSTKGPAVSLSDFKGKSNVVLAFFPAAFTGGCTAEMTAYGKDLEKFEAQGSKVFGVSTDNKPSQAYWATNVLKVDVPMLSDFMKTTSKEYGVLNEKTGTANRTTFVIDKDGKISYLEQILKPADISGAMDACNRLAH